MTRHFDDGEWRSRSVRIATLNLSIDSKSGEQLRCIAENILKNSATIGSDTIRTHTVTSDKDPSVKLACNLLKNYVGSVRFVVHTLALCVNSVLRSEPA